METKRTDPKTNRPILTIPVTPQWRYIDLACIAAVVANAVMTAYAWVSLPAVIPTHFGLSGTPDAWGPKATILLGPGMALVLYTLLSLVTRIGPHKFNYPVEITEENAERMYTLSLSMMRWLKLGLLLMFAFIQYATIQASLGKQSGNVIGVATIAGVLASFAMMIYFMAKFTKDK